MGIKEKRKERCWTQVELAEMVNVGQNTVSQWETGERTPRIEKLMQLARIFDCTVDELLRE